MTLARVGPVMAVAVAVAVAVAGHLGYPGPCPPIAKGDLYAGYSHPRRGGAQRSPGPGRSRRGAGHRPVPSLRRPACSRAPGACRGRSGRLFGRPNPPERWGSRRPFWRVWPPSPWPAANRHLLPSCWPGTPRSATPTILRSPLPRMRHRADQRMRRPLVAVPPGPCVRPVPRVRVRSTLVLLDTN